MTSTTLPRSDLTPFIAGWQGGSGPSMLLIHGVGLRAEAWGPMLPDLVQRFRVTVVDMPGHGGSAPLPGTPALAEYTDRLAKVLVGPSLVVGHSMGALIAMDLAVRHPALVSGIAPLNAIFRRSDAASRAVKSRAAELGAQALPDPTGTLKRWFGATPEGALKTAAADCHDWLSTVDPVGYRQAYTVFAAEDGPSEAALSSIRCPALFITGEDEPNSTPAMSQALARAVPKGRAKIIKGARHMMPMTHAAEVCALLAAFCQEGEDTNVGH